MPKAVYILFGALLAVASSYCLGRLLLNRLRVELYRQEERLFAFLCGAACLHLVVFALAAAGLARKGVFLVAGILFAIAAYRMKALRSAAPPLPALPRLWKVLFGAVYAPYAFLYLANAMAPEMSPDGSAYHLGLVSHYLRHRGFTAITTNMYANLTQGIEMLYMVAFSFGRHSAASLVHCIFTLTLPFLILAYSRRFSMPPAAGVAGALLVLCSPVAGVSGTTAYNDVAVASVVFSTVYLLHIWTEKRQPAMLIPIGLLAGYCFASKYTAAVAIPFAAAIIFFKSWRARGPLFRPLASFAMAAGIMVLPWMVKNWIVVDNPLSPFFNRFFPNAYVRISFEQEYIERMRNYGEPKSVAEIPLDLTVKGEKFAGMVGPVFVLAPLALLALRFPEGRRLLLAAAVFSLPYFNNIGTRFLLPALPFLSLAFGLACARTPGVLPALIVLHAFLSWPHILKKYCSPYAWRLERIPVEAALRITPEETYLGERAHGYPIARMVEDMVPAGESVFSFNGIPEAYTGRRILVAYQAAFNSNLGEFVWTGTYADAAPVRHLRLTFPGQPLRRLRLMQTTPAAADQWSITEFRVLHENKELARSAAWRVRASPNPWDVQLAFDNSPVTRWRTWETIRAGMFVEVDLGAEYPMDSVLLETVKDHYQVKIALYGQRETGEWKLLSDSPQETEVPVMRGLRRAAARELLTRGVRYILAAPDDPAAEDYRINAVLWGIRLLGERGGVRLYAILPDPK